MGGFRFQLPWHSMQQDPLPTQSLHGQTEGAVTQPVKSTTTTFQGEANSHLPFINYFPMNSTMGEG